MVIASKLPPKRTNRTYFGSGRAAFAFLLQEVVRPRRVFLPCYTCWSLVATMQRRFPQIELQFFPVRRDLTCDFPTVLNADDAVVLIHFFGYVHRHGWPPGPATVLEDLSHSMLSCLPERPSIRFGSLRKMARIADGGFVEGFHNPMYEASRKLDTWLRYESVDWRDMREAENMIDRDWQICDISSQSLAVLLTQDAQHVVQRRRQNERMLYERLTVGQPLREYSANECPLLHQRLFASSDERDDLRSFLMTRKIYCSIHWPTHPRVRESRCDHSDASWLELHSMAMPVSSEYDETHMEAIVDAVDEWKRAGA